MEAFGRLSSIKVINLNARIVLASEKMPSVRELDFTRARNRKFLELLKLFLENVEHPNAVWEADNHMETGGVDRHRVSFFFKLLNNVRSQLIFSAVVPNSNSSVTGASSHNLLFEADIHTEDRMRVERTYQVAVVLVVRRPFEVNWYFKDLVWAHGEH